jgi:hypothetical protein
MNKTALGLLFHEWASNKASFFYEKLLDDTKITSGYCEVSQKTRILIYGKSYFFFPGAPYKERHKHCSTPKTNFLYLWCHTDVCTHLK